VRTVWVVSQYVDHEYTMWPHAFPTLAKASREVYELLDELQGDIAARGGEPPLSMRVLRMNNPLKKVGDGYEIDTDQILFGLHKVKLPT